MSTYGQAEHDQEQMDRGRDQQDREEHERDLPEYDPDEFEWAIEDGVQGPNMWDADR